MPYRGGQLADLAPPIDAGVRRLADRATPKVGEELRKQVRRHTPFAKPGAPAVRGSFRSTADWIRARGGRRPGTLHDSWKVGEVRITYNGTRRVVEVYTLDPVAPHVEWDTVPHLIVAKNAKALTIPTAQGIVFAKVVQHPGTTGVHMMARSLQLLVTSWGPIVEREWSDEARVIWREARRGSRR